MLKTSEKCNHSKHISRKKNNTSQPEISTLTIELQHVNDKKYYFNSCKQTYPEDLYVHLVVSQMIECVLGAVT